MKFLHSQFYILNSASRRSGQVMVLTVLALGGTILGATTIAGLLMLYQVRQSTDLGSSAKAIFAADAGMEQSFFNLFCSNDDSKKAQCPQPALGRLSNGAMVSSTCYDAQGIAREACDDSTRDIRSIGTFGNASRAFEAGF